MAESPVPPASGERKRVILPPRRVGWRGKSPDAGVTRRTSSISYPGRKALQSFDVEVININLLEAMRATRTEHGFRFEDVRVGDVVATSKSWCYVEALESKGRRIEVVNLQTGATQTLFAPQLRWVWRAIV